MNGPGWAEWIQDMIAGLLVALERIAKAQERQAEAAERVADSVEAGEA